jgi:hypothetical protein
MYNELTPRIFWEAWTQRLRLLYEASPSALSVISGGICLPEAPTTLDQHIAGTFILLRPHSVDNAHCTVQEY